MGKVLLAGLAIVGIVGVGVAVAKAGSDPRAARLNDLLARRGSLTLAELHEAANLAFSLGKLEIGTAIMAEITSKSVPPPATQTPPAIQQAKLPFTNIKIPMPSAGGQNSTPVDEAQKLYNAASGVAPLPPIPQPAIPFINAMRNVF